MPISEATKEHTDTRRIDHFEVLKLRIEEIGGVEDTVRFSQLLR